MNRGGDAAGFTGRSGGISPRGRGRVRRILLDNGSPQLLNFGDVAMLHAAVLRLRAAFPGSHIDVVTEAPERLAQLCPGVHPVSFKGRELLCRIDTEYGANRLGRHPDADPRDLSAISRLLRRRSPHADVWWSKRRIRNCGYDPGPIDGFWRTVRHADLIVAAGGGYLTDVFPWLATDVLVTLRLAQRAGIPTALMGQGLGPMAGQTLRRLAAATLGAAKLVGLRERLASLPLLADLHVGLDHVTVTGDDAVEAATCVDPAPTGEPVNCIGVNIRVADYSNVGEGWLEPLRVAVGGFARDHHTSLVPLPVARHAFDDDCDALRRVLVPPDGGGGRAIDVGECIVTPTDLIRQVARCRVVVTGSYHAAVFALAQGRPVVAMTSSRYYDDKFAGLSDVFGLGCWIVSGERPDANALLTAIGQAWHAADAVRAPLMAAAAHMVAVGREAYARLPALVR